MPTDETLDLTDPSDSTFAVPDFADPPPGPQRRWWLRDGRAGSLLHLPDPARPTKTICRLTLHAGKWRPATEAEGATHRLCRFCSPPQAPHRKRRR
jgi:hypothetical protein